MRCPVRNRGRTGFCLVPFVSVFCLLSVTVLVLFNNGSIKLIITTTKVNTSTPVRVRASRSKPALVDVTEEEMVAEYFINFNSKNFRTSVDRGQLKAYVETKIRNATTHKIVWYNPPDYVVAETWTKKFKGCLYSNCDYTSDKSQILTSSAIMFCTTCSGMGQRPPIPASQRPPDQIWIFMSMESPIYHRWHSDFLSPHWRRILNWSMTYRIDSEVNIPYGYLFTRNVVPERNYSEIFSRKTKFAAWIVSHCDASSKRDRFIDILQAYGLPIDVYGKCGTPLEKEAKRMLNQTYKFYFSLENSLCKDYVTEKFFSYFPLDVVLIVRGGADYGRLLPNDSFIDSSSFSTLKDLAKYLLIVNSSETLYTSYLKKKDRFKAGLTLETVDMPACELCAKLNNKLKNRHVYEDIRDFIYTGTCQVPSDVGDSSHVLICAFILFAFYVIFLLFNEVFPVCNLNSIFKRS